MSMNGFGEHVVSCMDASVFKTAERNRDTLFCPTDATEKKHLMVTLRV